MADEPDHESFDYGLFEHPKPTHVHIMQIQAEMVRKMDRIETRSDAKFDRLLDALGHENDTANGGTGIIGRLARIEDRQRVADRWFQRAVGWVMGVAIIASVLWWVIGEKLGKLLKPV